jgi:hypothetical protein
MVADNEAAPAGREAVRRLDDTQLEAFDTEYIKPHQWPHLVGPLERFFGRDGAFTLLDVGGGNGFFVDRILAEFPNATATLVDNAQTLLNRNRQHPRKRLVLGSADDLSKQLGGQRFDVVSLHWVLHHMVVRSWGGSAAMQVRLLRDVRQLLSDRGRVSVLENMYQGRVVESFAPWLIYQLTSSRALAAVAKMGGANTAGVGVAFRDRASWLRTFGDAGLKVAESEPFEDWRRSAAQRLLTVRRVYVESFWLTPAEATTPAAAPSSRSP